MSNGGGGAAQRPMERAKGQLSDHKVGSPDIDVRFLDRREEVLEILVLLELILAKREGTMRMG